MERCSLCKEVKKCINNKNFGLICRQCYLKYIRPKKQCDICGNERPVGKNINGKPVCLSCYSKYFRVKRICNNCGNERFIVKNIDGKSICSACYKKNYRPQKICSICGNKGIVEKNIDGKPICRLCYEKDFRPKKICSKCGNECKVEKSIDEKPICSSCYQKYFRPKIKCSICGTEAIIAKKDDEKNICISCYNKSFRPQRLCHLCKKEGKTHKVIDGKSICPACYNKYYKPKGICNICGKEEKFAKKIEDKGICPSCYKKYYQKKELCTKCGKLSLVELRINNLPICSSCYHKFYKSKFTCYNCGTLSISSKVINGEHICPKCYSKSFRKKRICCICGSEANVSKVIDDKAICPSCYTKYFQPKRKCDLCGQEDIICLIDNGKNICRSCYHKTEGICINCGGVTRDHYAFRGICKECWYKEKLQTFIVVSKEYFRNNHIYDLFCRYADIVIKNRKQISAYLNITNLINLFLFIDKDNVNYCDITIEYFYKLTENFHNMTIQQFYNFLLSENILEPIEPLSVFDKIRFKYVNKLTGSFYDTLLRYTDYLISVCKKYKSKGWDNRLSIVTLMEYSYTTFSFLSFVSEKLDSIHEITNLQIDDFLAKTIYTYGHLRQFVKWLNNNVNLFSKIKLPHSHKNCFSSDTYNEEEIILIFESLFMNQISYKDKMICLLLIIYAVRPSEISKLTLNDFIYTTAESRLYVRKKWIILHPIIGSIIDNYIKVERSCSYSFGLMFNWIIPGKVYDKPISNDSIYSILQKYNIRSRKAYRTAIINQYMDNIYSPSLLVHGLGIHYKTAISYFNKFNINNAAEVLNCCTYDNKEKIYVYMLKCNDGTYYTGYTSNIQKRLQQHQNGTGCTYTKTRTPVELVYTEELPDKPSALKREKQIKKLTVFDKEKLIEKSRAN